MVIFPPVMSTLSLVVFAFTIFATLRVLYLISPFHLLSKFPGPKLWASCRIFWAYHHFKGDLVFKIKALHEIYGPIVRIAPNELSFISAGAWKDIYTANNDLRRQLPRDPFVLPPPPPDIPGDGLVLQPDDAAHAALRKQLGYAFTNKALDGQQPIIQHHINTLINRFRKLSEFTKSEPRGNIVDFAKWMSLVTFDIAADVFLGAQMGSLDTGEYHDIAARINGSNTTGAVLSCLARFGLVQILFKLGAREMARQQKEFNSKSMPLIERRLKDHEDGTDHDRRDICSYILNEKEDAKRGSSWTKDNLHLLAISVIVAGTETTGTAITGTMWFLLNNPECLGKLVTEVRGAFPEEADIHMTAVSKLPYLSACIEEGMRLATPAPFSIARKTPADMTIAGVKVPKGTSVGVPQYAAWHIEQNFDQAMDFVPERWLDGTQFVAGEKKGFVPFGVGPRNCLGKK